MSLLILLILLMRPGAAQAQFDFTTNSGAITITGYTGPGGAVSVPDMTNGLPIVGISSYVFEFTNITSVTIPASVTSIGDWAFYGCDSLTTITVDELNPVYGSSMDGVLFNKSQTALIQYPLGKVGSYTVPSSVTSIGSAAFGYCPGLADVTIPSSVTSIGDDAFGRCSSLTNVTIPNSVTSIGSWAFSDCASLTTITVSPLNPAYSSADGVLFDKSQTEVIQYPGGKAGGYTIPNGVTSIGIFAFLGCNDLTSVIIPSSVTKIGYGAFSDCDSLISVAIPNGVSNIGDWVFQYCTSLSSVTMGNNVTSIESYAFAGCNSLTNVTLSRSVTNIGDYAFSYCTSLTGVYFKDIPPDIGSFGFTNANNATMYYLPGSLGWGLIFGGRPTALWKPQVISSDASFGVRTNQFGFTIAWARGMTVAVEAATNWLTPNWVPLQTNTFSDDSLYFSDPLWTNYPGRFYRIRSP